MPWMTGCCCFRTLQGGSRGSAVFTFVIACCNIVIDCAALARLHRLERTIEPQEKFVYFPPGIIPIMWVELIISVLMIGLGICLIIGINHGYDGEKYLYVWVYGMVFDRLYDIFIGIYILSWIGGHRFTDVIFIMPESIVVAVYWMVNSFVLIAAIICVVSYWQEMHDELYGKERRITYYKKLANIRTAALSGAMTPYRSHFASQTTLVTSQGAVNTGYVEKY